MLPARLPPISVASSALQCSPAAGYVSLLPTRVPKTPGEINKNLYITQKQNISSMVAETAIASKNYRRPKTTGECGIF